MSSNQYFFEFQYIQCVGSSKLQTIYTHWFIVSIHPMCRFEISKWLFFRKHNIVSIHPMCRFELGTAPIRQRLKSFNTSNVSVRATFSKCKLLLSPFQYIQCVGSSNFEYASVVMSESFNTSNVSVRGWCHHLEKVWF